MLYKKYKPSDKLSPFIHTYYQWVKSNTEPLVVESPPSAYTALVFNLGEAHQFAPMGEEMRYAPSIYFAGQATKSYSLKFSGNIAMIGAVLYAPSIYKFFGGDQKGLIDQRVEAYGVESRELEKTKLRLFEDLEQDISKALDAFFLSIVERNSLVVDRFDQSVAKIDSKHGNVTLSDIMEEFGFSARYYQKLFMQRVGLSPKSYIRLRRLSRVCYLLSTKTEIDWQDIVYEGGYYDQSHFIKDFLDFIGRNPSVYFKDNKELARLLR